MSSVKLFDGDTQEQALGRVRAEIDAIDLQIQTLLNRRAECAQRVADIKHAFGADSPVFYRPEREAQVLRRAMERNEGPLPGKEIARLFREVMSVCLAHEHPMSIGFLASESEAAALKQFGHSVTPISFSTATAMFNALAEGELHYALVELSSVSESVDKSSNLLALLTAHHFNVVGEVVLADRQYRVLGQQDISPSGVDKSAAIISGISSIELSNLDDLELHVTSGDLTYIEFSNYLTEQALSSKLADLGDHISFHFLGSFPRAVI